MNIRECVIFTHNFIPDERFKEFIETIGYGETDVLVNRITPGAINFDSRVIKYVKEHSNWHGWDKVEYSMKGASSTMYRIGFAGTATIVEVDTDLPWTVGWDDVDNPFIKYIRHNKYNYCSFEIKII